VVTYAIPPDTRAVGTADPPGDMNNVADMLGLIARALAQLAGANNADPAGNAANVTALAAMVAAGTGTLGQLDARYLELADNLSDLASAPAARTNLGLGSAATQSTSAFDAAGAAATAQAAAQAASLAVANNLSDLASAGTARTNLGLGTAATQASSAFDASGAAAAAAAASLPLAGGTMSGAIAMGSHKVTGLTNGSSAQDAAAFGQLPVLSAGDASAVVGGTATAPTVESGTLDQVANLHPPAANWSNNAKKITAIANGSSAQDAAAYGQTPAGGAIVSGQLLCAPHVYAPAGQTALTAATTTLSAFDTTNAQTGSFTAPPSGEVVAGVTLVCENSAAAGWAIGLCAHGTVTPVLGNLWIWTDSSATATAREYSIEIVITGLTPGTSYNLDLVGCSTSGDTVTILAIGQTGTTPTLTTGSRGGPLTITVRAV
jgi:hypothetical protein